jgi:hypothetical protein
MQSRAGIFPGRKQTGEARRAGRTLLSLSAAEAQTLIELEENQNQFITHGTAAH